MSLTTRHDTFDAIIIGAGSIGLPTAFYLSAEGLKVLVIDQMPSAGQASNKHAIGGIRATHSDLAKIHLGKRSLEIFSTWEANFGEDIEWFQGGYSFVAYTQDIKQLLQNLVRWQQDNQLNISWLEPKDLVTIIPHINQTHLLGGTYSPEDGSASPLKTAFSFHKKAVEAGSTFHFNEKVTKILASGSRVSGVVTNRGKYSSPWVINAAGGGAKQISASLGLQVPIEPDSHEAAITEPVARLFDPMVVDMRARPGSANFYFYQHPTGKIIFCMTPEPPIAGTHTIASSEFLPLAARRLIEIMPILQHIRVRRVWRGIYPMTPDGSPIIGSVDGLDGLVLAVGMCGQGFMFGPGVGQLIRHIIINNLDEQDKIILESLTYHRNFETQEKLK